MLGMLGKRQFRRTTFFSYVMDFIMQKKYLYIVFYFALCCSQTVWAGVQSASGTMEVNVETLNMRRFPSAVSPIELKLHKGDVVIVTSDVQDGWVCVQIDEYTGYVKYEYLVPYEESVDTPQSSAESSWSDMIRNLIHWDFLNHSSRLPVYIGLVVMIIFGLSSQSILERPVYYLDILLFFVASLCAIIQFQGFDGDITWFYSPSKIGWGYTIIGFFFFVVAFLNYVYGYLKTLQALNYFSRRRCLHQIGLYALIVSLIILALTSYFKGEYTNYAIGLVIITQIAQVIYYIYATIEEDSGNWGNLLVTIIVYFLGIYCISIFSFILIPAAIAAAVVIVVANGSNTVASSSSSSSGPQHRQIFYRGGDEPYYVDKDGNHVPLRRDGSGFAEYNGKRYDENGFDMDY